jgi:hypothetical protein
LLLPFAFAAPIERRILSLAVEPLRALAMRRKFLPMRLLAGTSRLPLVAPIERRILSLAIEPLRALAVRHKLVAVRLLARWPGLPISSRAILSAPSILSAASMVGRSASTVRRRLRDALLPLELLLAPPLIACLLRVLELLTRIAMLAARAPVAIPRIAPSFAVRRRTWALPSIASAPGPAIVRPVPAIAVLNPRRASGIGRLP